MTNYNELIGRHLVLVSLTKGEKPEISRAVDGIIEEVDATTMQNHVFFRIKGEWAVCSSKSDVDAALAATGKEYLFETAYNYFKIV